jgi:hypothetical protein
MPSLSGFGPTVVSQPVTVRPFSPRAMPARQSVGADGRFVIDRLDSTPGSRAGANGGVDVLTISDTGPVIGKPADQSARNARVGALVEGVNRSTGTVTAAQAAANADAVAARRAGVLGCLKIGGNPATPEGCAECSTIDCLEELLAGDLLDLDAKRILCDLVSEAERAAKRQVDQAGNSLLRAAQELTSANAIKQPLNSLANFINGLNAGAIANCLGAQELKDRVNGKLKQVVNTISAAEKGVHDKIADKFNKATEKAQQFSITPAPCKNGSSGPTLRSLL